MNTFVDIAVICLILLCGWHGFRTGLINGILCVLAVIITIWAAGLLANTYYAEFDGMLEPFATGIVDAKVTKLLDWESSAEEAPQNEAEETEEPAVILTPEETSDVYAVSYHVLTGLGINEKPAEQLARTVADKEDRVGQRMCVTLTEVLCDRLTYIAVFGIAFMLVGITFCAIANIIDIKFGIPGLENVSHALGALLGLGAGVLIVAALAIFFRYLGLVVPDSIINGTKLFSRFISENHIADYYGI